MKGIKIVLLAVVASLMFVCCGNNAKTPSGIAKKVLEASKNLDFTTIKQYLVEERIVELMFAESEMKNVETANKFKNRVKGSTIKVLSETISEDRNSAVVVVKIFIKEEEPYEYSMDFVMVDGEWKVDSRIL